MPRDSHRLIDVAKLEVFTTEIDVYFNIFNKKNH